jgi:hypothetical protein
LRDLLCLGGRGLAAQVCGKRACTWLARLAVHDGRPTRVDSLMHLQAHERSNTPNAVSDYETQSVS